MEIKANYVLIGIFTIVGLLGALGFLLWLASVQIDRQFQRYYIYFDSVSGLSEAGEVRYNGLPVGQVIELGLDPAGEGVRALIEIDADTPVRVGSTAQLSAQGVTGVSFVSISGGEADEPLLRTSSPRAIPVIPSRPSALQTLTEQGPDLVTEAVELISRLQSFVGPQNQERVSTLLENLSSSSGALDTALSDFSSISTTVETATAQITDFTSRLDAIGGAVETTLGQLDGTLATARETIAEAEMTLSTATEALGAARQTFDLASSSIETQVPRISDDLSTAIRSADSTFQDAMGVIGQVAARLETTADLADARLSQLGETLDVVDTTLADASVSFDAVEEASEAVEVLVEGTGASLVDEARVTLETVDESLGVLNETVKRDLPRIAESIRTASEGAASVVTAAQATLEALPDRLDPLSDAARTTLTTATDLLRRAEGSLDAIGTTLSGADRTLAAAEQTFTGVNEVLETEVAPAAADIRAAASGIDEAMAALTEELPAIAANLSETAARARNIAETIDAAVAAAVPGVRAFSQRGLPEFTQLARRAQDAVTALQRLLERIERDPTRFIFGTSSPEFRR